MEGLIKGLINVALGRDENADDGERGDHNTHTHSQSQSQSHDEQNPRSTWAQVVSGDQDDDGFSRDHSKHDHHRRDENYGRNEGWESSGSQPLMRPQKGYERPDDYVGHKKNNQSNWNKQESEESNDGWETAHKKHSRIQKLHMDQWTNFKRAPEEQAYNHEVKYGNNMEPSHEELADLSKASNKLWELDLNRLVPGKDYEIDVGEGKKVYEKGDRAEESFFSWVNEDIFKRPTFARFCSLLDNYNPHEGYKENVTSQEKQEQAAFIEEISRTAPIKYLYNYLVAKGIVSGSYEEFKRMISSLWFDLYNRGGTCGSSSAFEHVFVGEIKQHGEQEVSGFHNWLQFYLEEAKGRVNYQGYIFPRRRGHIPDLESQLLTIQFEWNGVLKSVSSTLVGVSPEFEMALYTLCFFVGREDNQIELGPYPVNVKCYRFGNKLGSAFPIAEC